MTIVVMKTMITEQSQTITRATHKQTQLRLKTKNKETQAIETQNKIEPRQEISK